MESICAVGKESQYYRQRLWEEAPKFDPSSYSDPVIILYDEVGGGGNLGSDAGEIKKRMSKA